MAVVRSAGIGLMYMLVISLIIGFIGIEASVSVVLFCILSSYILTGWIAAKEKESPYVIAGIGALILYVNNLLFTFWFVGIAKLLEMVITLFVAVGAALCGVWFRKRVWNQKGTKECKQSIE